MSPIKSQFIMLTLAACTLSAFFAFKMSDEARRTQQQEAYVSEQMSVQHQLLSIQRQFTYRSDVFGYLQSVRVRMPNSAAREKLSDAIQAYSAHDSRAFAERAQAFYEQSQADVSKSLREIEIRRSQHLRYLELALLAPICCLILVVIIAQRRVFNPLKKLSQRMYDFLNDRYAFQFAAPENNEVGAMQSIFNSLAQRVINNLEDLRRLDQAKSDFLNIASHELRTPMTSIKGSLNLLANQKIGTMDAAAMRMVVIAETEADRLIRLINDLLDLAKIEAGKMPFKCSWLTWEELTHSTIDSFASLSQKSQVEIMSVCDFNLEVFADRDRIQQVLNNLISNALKFSPPHSKITVTARIYREKLLIEVRDQGPGITEAEQQSIFEKFTQADAPSNTLVKGTGLGLAISRAIVDQHGGFMGVESSPPHGATFYFSVPQFRAEAFKWEDAA